VRGRGLATALSRWSSSYAADASLQTHGGCGYAREHHVERYFRESRLLRITPVSQEIILNHVNDHVPKLPKS
jgi:acyl-CoA dehydrogenase